MNDARKKMTTLRPGSRRRAARADAAYGLLTTHPEVARAVDQATAAMKGWTPREWLAANPQRRWAVFWMFRRGACAPRGY